MSGEYPDHPAHRDHVEQLDDVGDLGAGAVAPRHSLPARQRLAFQVGHAYRSAPGQPVPGRDDGHAVLGVQRLVGQAVEVVERRVEQTDVGPAVAQEVGAVGGAAEQDVHPAGVGPAGVLGQDSGEQAGVAAGLEYESQVGLDVAGPPGALDGGADRVERVPPVFLQRLPGRGELDVPAGADEQRDAEPGLDPPYRLRQRRLGDGEAGGGPSEVQLVGECEEVFELACFQFDHASRLSPDSEPVLDGDGVRP